MSSRIATYDQCSLARPFQAPPLEAPKAAPVRDERSEELKLALANALTRTSQLQDRIKQLEASLTSSEEAAFERGSNEGHALGLSEGRAEMKTVQETMARAIAEMATLRTRIRSDAERDLVKLSIEIARRILNREVNVDPEALLGVLRAALDRVRASEIQSVRVHPQHADAIREYLSRLGVAAAVTVEPDPALDRGDLQLATQRGTLDASVATQLAEVERGFIERLK